MRASRINTSYWYSESLHLVNHAFIHTFIAVTLNIVLFFRSLPAAPTESASVPVLCKVWHLEKLITDVLSHF